ncbi:MULTISPECIES: restriction endonuclease subunit S [unclassified Streptomyces]|uniref:restriction endonuclease subunit S n=1 Tax=unclassified Streptomyces TaxID=2593676 RepID=UPI00332F7F58
MSLPSAWSRVTLGEICEFKYGKSLPAKSRIPGDFHVYGSNGVVGTHVKPVTSGPTVVIGRKGSFGEIHYSENPCWPIDTTYYIDANSTQCDLKWLSYVLPSLGLTSLNRAAAIPGLNREDAYRQPLSLPPLAEQRRIVQVLERVDALRSKRQQAVALLDRLTQSIFLEMFGNPRENPNGWPVDSLANLADSDDRINYGVVQPGDDFSEGVPLVRVGDLSGGRVDRSAIKRIAPQIEAKYSRSRLRGNEILVGCVGSIGSVALVGKSDVGSNIARAVARIPISDVPLREYLAEHLRSASVQQYFRDELRTVAQPTLNIKQLSETVVMVPPVKVQVDFGTRIAEVRRQKHRQSMHRSLLDSLFISLQHRALRDELWVNVDPITA